MKHTFDFIFPITLFFVFTSTALVVLLCSANIYQNVVDASARSFETSTTLAYITEKIRQNDTSLNQRISIETFDGYEALTISQTINNTLYHTYIYEAEGELKELFIQDAISASADFGTTILEIGHLEMNEISDGLFQFICTSTDGSTDSVTISTRSYIH